MSQAISHTNDHHEEHEHHEDLSVLGFWLFLVSDVILFGTIFATFMVLRSHFDGGPTGKELFEAPGYITETFLLLTSSFTSGLATLALNKGKVNQLIGWLVVTALLGLGFIGFEVSEFANMVSEGATISRSAFLTAFFTLVGTHGLHVSVGLCWMTAIMIQLKRNGINALTTRKVTLVSLYWHFLDVVWIFLLTIVYLMGVM
ncbi:cytochrome o ubiquinol oxidase subunit III [Falsibacillus pallidus]|uniref:Cytochrome bo(3) ubiquinol oxidase subunit 3 n=1 Tax=Falsibacillus pallidus TaxID=493781 RepID=A0A370G5M4_9BACI|nr:cytochrome o ubiquinol oxidase subunit III [Falsibacillus pallidus]RDI39112.1 cytochrome o ubiquinol oxidase subunit 3 [Falsibacillus pallidus]